MAEASLRSSGGAYVEEWALSTLGALRRGDLDVDAWRCPVEMRPRHLPRMIAAYRQSDRARGRQLMTS
jgi:hypothetical protein